MTIRKDGRRVKKITIDGKPKYFYSTATTDRKAELDFQRQIAEYKHEQFTKKHNFKNILDDLMVWKESTISYNTYESYKHTIKHLDVFYDCNIEDIRPAMVQKLLNDLSKKNYSYSHINKVRTVFGMALDFAILNNNLMIANFTSSIKIPKTAKKGKVTAPDDETIDTIINNADKVNFGMWNMMLLCSGLRRGEICALQKKDINFENDLIPVTKAVEFHGNQPHIKECPKTEDSIGTVPILSVLRPYLIDYCNDLKDDDFLFGKEKPLTVSAIRRRTEKYCKEIGHTYTLHQLRHAYAKLLYCAGVDPKTMQRLLRHANFQTTMNIYTEFDEQVTNDTVKIINKYMNKRKERFLRKDESNE